MCLITCVVEMEESLACMIKLKSGNYGIWKSMMEDLLHMKNLHKPIEGEEAKPADLDDKKRTQLNQKAMVLLDHGLIRVCTTM